MNTSTYVLSSAYGAKQLKKASHETADSFHRRPCWLVSFEMLLPLVKAMSIETHVRVSPRQFPVDFRKYRRPESHRQRPLHRILRPQDS